MNNSTC